jgi:hypothetical protein
MKAKAVVTGILALFVVVSLVYLAAKETRKDAATPEQRAGRVDPPSSPRGEQPGNSPAGQTSVEKVIVYYFHGKTRCPTCRKIEAYAEEAIRTSFASELASGKLEWQTVNVDEPENMHFVQDYQLVTRSLVLVGEEKDVQESWKNLEKIWELVHTKQEFTDYVVKNTREFMAGGDG